MRDPATPAEWQDAVDAAHALLLLGSARAYGLVTGGPLINEDRVEEILEQGRRRGITPAVDAVERLIAELAESPPASGTR